MGSCRLLGIGYAFVGIVLAVPVTHVRAWRLGAWVVSAIGYAAHTSALGCKTHRDRPPCASPLPLRSEHSYLLLAPTSIHAAGSTQRRQLLLVSLGIWPVITALPAFLFAFGAIWFWHGCSGAWKAVAECWVWSDAGLQPLGDGTTVMTNPSTRRKGAHL